MVKYLIIEDEAPAYKELKRMMDDLRPQFRMSGWAQSVAQSVELIRSQEFDLILSDISLADGLCFEIFERTAIDIPVIFTTAYDEFAIKAFKVNGIDYLLKPIEKEDLSRAIERFERKCALTSSSAKMAHLRNEYINAVPKRRFLIQSGPSYIHVPTDSAAYFYSEDKYTYIHLFSGKRHIVDYTLDKLEEILDPEIFFRISRNCILNINSVKRCGRLLGGRLKVHCHPDIPMELHVSRNRAKNFLDWIDGII